MRGASEEYLYSSGSLTAYLEFLDLRIILYLTSMYYKRKGTFETIETVYSVIYL